MTDDLLSPEEIREAAMTAAATRVGFTFNGSPLESFGFARNAAVQRMDIGGLSPLENATMLVFVCTCSPERLDKARTREEVAILRTEMNAWADVNKITLRSPTGIEVRKIADAIWADMDASEAVVERSRGGAKEAPKGSTQPAKQRTTSKPSQKRRRAA